jgi:uncharacterized protein (TIGR02145 family)
MKRNILTVLSIFWTLNLISQTATDIDGNAYNTIIIGDQIWMKEDLKVSHYNNGDTIPNIMEQGEWDTLTTGALSNYFNDEGNVGTYGRMYNWYAVNDSRSIAPTGWHIPSESEWLTLFNYLGGVNEASHKLRETGENHWNGYCGGAYNNFATNESGFTALPGGFRIVGETFEYRGDFGGYYGSNEVSSENAFYFYLTTCDAYVNTGDVPKAMGLSIRCICDTLYSPEIPPTENTDRSVSNQIQIFPNPAVDRITISCMQQDSWNLQVYNTQGDCVMEHEIVNIMNEININTLTEGIYSIRLTNSNQVITKKLMKIR